MKFLLLGCIVISLVYNVDAQVQKDKLEHFTAGAVISVVTAESLFKITHKKKESILIGIGMGCIAGATKELYDLTGRGTPDVKDFIWTCIGSSVSSVSLVIKF